MSLIKKLSHDRTLQYVLLFLLVCVVVLFLLVPSLFKGALVTKEKPGKVYTVRMQNIGEPIQQIIKSSTYPFKLTKDWKGSLQGYVIQDQRFVLHYGRDPKVVTFPDSILMTFLTNKGKVNTITLTAGVKRTDVPTTKLRLQHISASLNKMGWQQTYPHGALIKSVNKLMREDIKLKVGSGDEGIAMYQSNDECLQLSLHPHQGRKTQGLTYLVTVNITKKLAGEC
tara:strand:- start:74093 stop:74770 length:678 start_codon:yes stop_codon:yes gene_type:complete